MLLVQPICRVYRSVDEVASHGMPGRMVVLPLTLVSAQTSFRIWFTTSGVMRVLLLRMETGGWNRADECVVGISGYVFIIPRRTPITF